MLTAINLSLSLMALHFSPTCWVPTIYKSTHPCFFLEKENFINFNWIHQDDTSSWNLPGLCSKRAQPLVIANPMIRPPPKCLGKKKYLNHLSQEMRCHYKRILWDRLLKNSPHTEPVTSRVDNLQKGKKIVIKNHSISVEPDRPTQGCSTYKD